MTAKSFKINISTTFRHLKRPGFDPKHDTLMPHSGTEQNKLYRYVTKRSSYCTELTQVMKNGLFLRMLDATGDGNELVNLQNPLLTRDCTQ